MNAFLQRAYFSATFDELGHRSASHVLGELARHHAHELNEKQRNAWVYQIEHLQKTLPNFSPGHVSIEFHIPRMGKRVDVLLLYRGKILLLEYKVGAKTYDGAALDQVLDYALDLRNFHSTSHKAPIVPVLVCTAAPHSEIAIDWGEDGVAEPLRCSAEDLSSLLHCLDSNPNPDLDAKAWIQGTYRPTPTIIEAARALYAGHSVEEISRSDAGAHNLTITAETVRQLIVKSQQQKQKTICFITGVPGSGKTLAGLNLAAPSQSSAVGTTGVYLSGNGPLVDVLREALARDEQQRAKEQGQKLLKKDAFRRASAFIQNIHHFRDEGLRSPEAPAEKIVVFDEAQRAWTQHNLASWMKERKGVIDFPMSEPELLLSVMDRHEDWCVVICLVGGGQEINTGEVGISEWFRALEQHFPHWTVTISDSFPRQDLERFSEEGDIVCEPSFETYSGLHLQTSLRSFRSENVSRAVDQVIDRPDRIEDSVLRLPDYPFVITRNLATAKEWLKCQARGTERLGLVASSKALRLRPFGIYVKAKITPKDWFLNSKTDVRSSFALEEVASEFDIQGLELDWIGVCWGADLRHTGRAWSHHHFRGSRWTQVNQSLGQRYLENAYRVLLTRARQGTVIYLPSGLPKDHTTLPEHYELTYQYLLQRGVQPLD
jgi:hypothetical protein